jgi:hypothetical protein
VQGQQIIAASSWRQIGFTPISARALMLKKSGEYLDVRWCRAYPRPRALAILPQ